MEKEKMNTKKIIVLGGGPAGLAASLALRKYGFEVITIERTKYDTYCPGEHLIPEGIPLLNKLGIPKSVWEKHSSKCYEVESIWGNSEPYSKNSIFNLHGEGILLSRPAFDRELAEFTSSKEVHVITGAKVKDLQKNTEGWAVEYICNENIKEIQADFVVDASGRNSMFTPVFGARKNKYDNLIAVTALFQPNNKSNLRQGKILLEAVEKGWWYSAPLKDGTVIATFVSDADVFNQAGTIETAFQYFLTSSNSTKDRLYECKKIQKLQVVSARSQIISQLYGNEWIAVGDAAWSIDPLSSQGIYKALLMAIDAAQAVHDHFTGNSSALQDYSKYFIRMFYDYIKLRLKYYRMELRWKDESFWKRRHKPCWIELPISLSPEEKIHFRSNTVNSITDEIKRISPSVDTQLLSDILSKSSSAFEAAFAYKRQARFRSEDKELIVSIQEMLRYSETDSKVDVCKISKS
jgi:flavin-dependent dehydrogenase